MIDTTRAKIIEVMEVMGMDVANLEEYPTDMLGQVFEVWIWSIL